MGTALCIYMCIVYISMKSMEETTFLFCYSKIRLYEISLKLTYHKVYSAAGCRRSLKCDQTIGDIIIFSSAFLVEGPGWLNLPGGSTLIPHSLLPRLGGGGGVGNCPPPPAIMLFRSFVGICKPTSMTKYVKYQQNIERHSSFYRV